MAVLIEPQDGSTISCSPARASAHAVRLFRRQCHAAGAAVSGIREIGAGAELMGPLKLWELCT